MKFEGLVLAAVTLGCSLPLNADVVFNDFGPGNGVLNSMEWQVNAGFVPTVEFSSPLNYRVKEIDLYLTWSHGTNGATVSLLSSKKNGAPGIVLGSWKVSGQPLSDSAPPLTKITNIDRVHLTAGKSYFLRVEPADDTTSDGWVFNYLGTQTALYNGNAAAYSSTTAPAFDVIGIAESPGSTAPP